MRSKVMILFLILFSASIPCYSQELTRDALIQGVNQARRTLQSGEVTAITTFEHRARKNEAEIAEAIRVEKQQALQNFRPDPSFPDVDVKTFEKDYLTPKMNYRYNRDRKRTERDHSTIVFQNVFPAEATQPTHYQYKVTTIDAPNQTLDSEAAAHFDAQRFSLLAYDGDIQVKLDIGNIIMPFPLSQAIRLFNSDRHGGYWDFSLFGRTATPIPADAALIGTESIEGATCYILKTETQNGDSKRIWVDIDKDFCIRKIEIHTPNGAIDRLTLFKKFEKFGEFWVPRLRESTFYRKDGTFRATLRIEITTAVFNVNFPQDFFNIDSDFYRNQMLRRPDTGFLPDSGVLPTPDPTEAEKQLLLCGPQSLSRVCERLKVETNLSELKKLSNFHPDRGTTMLGLKNAATFKGLAPTGVKATVTLLKREKVPMPAIAYVNNNHFLIFEKVNKNGVDITDPAQKYNPHLSWDKLTEIWDGDLLIFDQKKARRTKQKQAPLAFTEAPAYDFGKALGGSHIKHTFTIKNIGQKPLQILSVTETCACTASVLSQDEIPPGSTGSISTVLTVPSGNQHVNENLLVLTNDPVQSTITLSLKGEAFIPLKTFPERLAFGNQKPLQTPLTKRVSLHLQDGVELLNIRTDSAHLNTTLQTENDIPFVALKFLPTLPVGQFSHNLLIDYTYEGEQTTHNVLVFGEVLGELQVVPNRLFFGLIKDPSTVSKTITIFARESHPIHITDVVSTTKGVVVEKKAGTAETEYQLITTISPKTRPGELTGEIIIHTDSPVQPTVHVPFFGILAGKN